MLRNPLSVSAFVCTPIRKVNSDYDYITRSDGGSVQIFNLCL